MHSTSFPVAGVRLGLTAALLGTTALVAAPAMAQSGSAGQGLGEIVVTASKRSENLQDVPISISAIGAEQLASRGVTASADLGNVVPNLQVSSQYGETSPNFSLRGVGVANEFTSNTASPIGVYVDEVSQTFRYTHGLQLYDLERVEVLRGPQGTLFGRNTTGGAINMYTRKPQLEDANGYLTAGFGNYNRWKIQGAAEATLVPDQVGLRLAFNRLKGDGYFSEPDKVAGAHDSYGTADSIGLRGNLRIKPNDDLDINIGAYYAKDDPIGYPLHYLGLLGADANGNGGTDFFGSTRQGGITPGGAVCCSYKEVSYDKQGKFLTESWGLNFNLNYQIGDNWSITSVTGYTDSKYNLDIDNDATPQDIYFIFYRSKGKDFSQDFRINYDSESLKGLLGIYYGNDKIDTNNTVLAYNVLPDFPADGNPADWAPGVNNSFNVLYGFRQKRKTFAIYSEATLSITQQLELTAGLRYTKDKLQYANGYSHPITDFPGVEVFSLYDDLNLKNSYDNWSGRAILNYAWTDSIKTYLSFSRGYRSGSYNGFGFVTPAAVYFVQPEKLDSWEFGFKTRFAGDRVQINGAVFHYDYQNQQVSEVIGGLSFNRNLSGKVKGFEVELLAKPIPALTLRGAVGYLDTKYNKKNPCLSPDGIETEACGPAGGTPVAGNQIPFASKWTLSGGGDLTLGTVADGDIVFSGEVSYKSSFWYDMFNDNARPPALVNDGMGGTFQLYPGGKTDLVGSKGYALVNASLAWNHENYQIKFWGKNVFDKKYYPFGYDTAGAFGTVLLVPGMPRTYGVEATVRF
ncbi:MAG: TonB-dependent receptor [Novosphingobium sp.]|nr:TonB-dependent receptor [Novosphingobium sp.]